MVIVIDGKTKRERKWSAQEARDSAPVLNPTATGFYCANQEATDDERRATNAFIPAAVETYIFALRPRVSASLTCSPVFCCDW